MNCKNSLKLNGIDCAHRYVLTFGYGDEIIKKSFATLYVKGHLVHRNYTHLFVSHSVMVVLTHMTKKTCTGITNTLSLKQAGRKSFTCSSQQVHISYNLLFI